MCHRLPWGSYDLDFKNPESNPDDWVTGAQLNDIFASFCEQYPVESIEDTHDQVRASRICGGRLPWQKGGGVGIIALWTGARDRGLGQTGRLGELVDFAGGAMFPPPQSTSATITNRSNHHSSALQDDWDNWVAFTQMSGETCQVVGEYVWPCPLPL